MQPPCRFECGPESQVVFQQCHVRDTAAALPLKREETAGVRGHVAPSLPLLAQSVEPQPRSPQRQPGLGLVVPRHGPHHDQIWHRGPELLDPLRTLWRQQAHDNDNNGHPAAGVVAGMVGDMLRAWAGRHRSAAHIAYQRLRQTTEQPQQRVSCSVRVSFCAPFDTFGTGPPPS